MTALPHNYEALPWFDKVALFNGARVKLIVWQINSGKLAPNAEEARALLAGDDERHL